VFKKIKKFNLERFDQKNTKNADSATKLVALLVFFDEKRSNRSKRLFLPPIDKENIFIV